MTIDEIRFKIWVINETVLHLGDIEDKTTDPETRERIRAKIDTLETEKKALYQEWEKLNGGLEA